MVQKIKKILALTVMVALLSSSAVFAYDYMGIRWAGNSAYYGYNSNLPSSWQTQVYSAAGTWNSPSNFKLYNSSSASNAWGASNWGASGQVAVTRYYNTGSTLNTVYSDYNTYWSFSSNPNPDQYDLKTVALHEFGHWLMLDDLYDDGDYQKVMYAYMDPGVINRSLTQDDINGIRSIYGY